MYKSTCIYTNARRCVLVYIHIHIKYIYIYIYKYIGEYKLYIYIYHNLIIIIKKMYPAVNSLCRGVVRLEMMRKRVIIKIFSRFDLFQTRNGQSSIDR